MAIFFVKGSAGRRRAQRLMALGATGAMLLSPAGGLLTPALAQAPVRDPNSPTVNGPALPPPIPVEEPVYGTPSILLFPFDNNTGTPAVSDVAAQLTDAIKFRLNSIGAYKTTEFTKFLAPVQRALADGVLQSADVAPPFSDSQKSQRIAAQVETNDFLIGSIESYTTDPTTRRVTIEVTADLRGTRSGNAVRTLAFTGVGVPYGADETQAAVVQRAVNSAASRIAAAINGNRPPSVLALSQEGHTNPSAAILLTLLGGGLLYAIFHNSSHSSSSSSGTTGTTTTTTTTGTGSSLSPPAAPTP